MRSLTIFALCALGLFALTSAAPAQEDITREDLRVLREFLIEKLASHDAEVASERQAEFRTPPAADVAVSPTGTPGPLPSTPPAPTTPEEVPSDDQAVATEAPVAEPTPSTHLESSPAATTPPTPAATTPRTPAASTATEAPVEEELEEQEESEDEEDEPEVQPPPPPPTSARPTPVVDPVPQEPQEPQEPQHPPPPQSFPLNPLVAYFAGPAMPPTPLEQADLDRLVSILFRYIRGAGTALEDSLASFESDDMLGMSNEVTAATQALQAAASEITTFFFKYLLYGLDIDQNCKDPDVAGCEEEYQVCIHDSLAKLGAFYNNPSEFIPSQIDMPACEAPATLDNGAMEVLTACVEAKVTLLGAAVSRIQEYVDLARIQREAMTNGVFNAHDEAIQLLLEGGRDDVIRSVAVFYHVATTLTSELHNVNIPH